MIVRAPFAWTTVWAEDGKVVLGGAITSGISAFGQLDGGYLLFVPRVGGAIAAALPLGWASFVMASFAAMVTAAAAGYVEFASGSQLQRRWVRIGLGLTIPMLPALREEVIGDMADLAFILLFVCFWILLWLPRRWPGQIIGMLALLSITFSTLLVTFLVPLALFRLFLTGRRRALAASFLLGIGGHWLVVVLERSKRGYFGTPATISEAVHAYGNEVIGPQLLGGPFHETLTYWHPTVLLSLAVLVILVVSVSFCRGDRYRYMAITWLSLITSFVVYIGEALSSGVVPSRYAVFPALLLMTAIAMATDSVTRMRFAFVMRAALAVAVVLMSWTFSFAPTAYRRVGPQWSSEVAVARRECLAGAKYVDLALLPVQDEPGGTWGYADLPCRTVIEGL
ncbi:MAG: hypothetical protein ABSD85_17905 [Acidimicrobiales bacterium]